MDQWRKNGLDQMERNGYLPVLRSLVHSLTAPFWWFHPDLEIGASILHNGTLCFINTGSEIIGVTAAHVYRQYLADREADSKIVCQIGSATLAPERYIIAVDEERDLATFSIPEFLIAASKSGIHHAIEWPPRCLEARELVIFGGYPRILREEKPSNAQFPFVSFISRVDQHSEDHVSFYLNIGDSHWPQGESLESNPDLGGISGGPIFRIRTDPFDTLEIAGFIYECDLAYEIVFARHASEICFDGKMHQQVEAEISDGVKTRV